MLQIYSHAPSKGSLLATQGTSGLPPPSMHCAAMSHAVGGLLLCNLWPAVSTPLCPCAGGMSRSCPP
jgi:hypothetical protein